MYECHCIRHVIKPSDIYFIERQKNMNCSENKKMFVTVGFKCKMLVKSIYSY